MDHNITLETKNLIIKPMSSSDSERYRLLRNLDCNRYRFINTGLISKEQQASWFTKYLSGPDYMFSVYCKTPESPVSGSKSKIDFIGGAGIYDIDYQAKTAEFGRIIIDNSKCGGKGYGCEALLGLCDISRDHLKLKSLHLEVLRSNTPAIKTYEKAGFTYIESSGNTELFLMEKIL